MVERAEQQDTGEGFATIRSELENRLVLMDADIAKLRKELERKERKAQELRELLKR